MTEPPESGPVLVVATADWHCNDIVGLCPPVFKREKLAKHRPGPAIRAIWRAWTQFWEIIAAKKAATGATVYAFCAGDLCDFNKHSGAQLISMRGSDVLAAMVDVATPMLDVADHIFVIRGTAAHTGGTGGMEEVFADDIGAVYCKEEDSASWWCARVELGGVRFDVAHHPPTGSMRPWTLNQAAARAGAIVATRYAKEKLWTQTPDVAIWGHYHKHAQGEELGVHGFVLPSWKLLGEYGHRLGLGAHVEQVGGLWFLCENGKYDWDWELWRPKRGKIWVPPTVG